MGDPRRLLSASSDADELERSLLESLQAGPEQEQKAALWRALSAQVATVAVVAGASSAAASNAAVVVSGAKAPGLLAAAGTLLPKALAAKVALAVVVSALGAGVVGVATRDVAPPAREPAVRALPPVAHVAPAAQSAPAVPERAAPRPSLAPPTPARGHKVVRQDALEAESRLLTSARAQLRQGDTRAAELTLTRLRKQFSHGVLLQERELLQIELLALQGHHAAARKHAQAFAHAHPESPHRQALARYLDAP